MGRHLTEAQLETIRTMRSDGYGFKAISKATGATYKAIKRSCDANGWEIDAEKETERRGIQTVEMALSYDEVSRKIEELTASAWQYVGGYENYKSTIEIKCSRCGNILRLSADRAFRKGEPIACKKCKQAENERRAAEVSASKAYKKRIAALQKSIENEIKRFSDKLEMEYRECADCGRIFYSEKRKQRCDNCDGKHRAILNKKRNSRRGAQRRAKLSAAMVDKDINLVDLFKKSNGICYLCGKPCDTEDRHEANGTIICGDMYPSIDHVIPLARGGQHSWNNVRLAHRICNSLKADK